MTDPEAEAAADPLPTWLAELPDVGMYLLMGALAAVKNVLPPFPGDSLLLLSALLVGQGTGTVWIAALAASAGSMVGTVSVYEIARRYGTRLYAAAVARRLIRPAWMQTVNAFYDRYGAPGLFVTRLLPGVRYVVPWFAAMGGMERGRALPPMILASALWYGALVAFGGALGEWWRSTLRRTGDAFAGLPWIVAAGVILGLLWLLSRLVLARRRGPAP